MISYFLLCLVGLASATRVPIVSHPRYNPYNGDQRIVGGDDAAKGEFPWQATLQQNGRHFCGGSLISERHVMSAAHCVSSNTRVGLGAVDYRNPEQLIAAASFTPHPLYNANTLDYDFAVITMTSSASLGGNVNTIKLVDNNKEYSNMIASTSGWGYDTQVAQSTPIALQKATLPLVSQSTCQSIWGSAIEITDRIQCAGGDGKISSCMGDSGGPLTVYDGQDILIGAVSWVQSRCSSSYPGGYAKISSVRGWVDSQMN